MIDYIKIRLLNIDIVRLLNTFEFFEEFCQETGETKGKRVAEYHFCKITIYPNDVVLFTGSIHKLYNSLNNTKAPNYKCRETYKGFNGNQFTYKGICKVRSHLAQLFDITPNNMIFQNIEFGINTTILFDPQIFIKGLLFHNGKKFEFRYNDFFAQVLHQRYYIKIYNKSTQYGMPNYSLRIELKVIKTEDIKHLGIRTFADINPSSLNKAKDLLLKRFDEVVYYDNTILKKSLSGGLKSKISDYKNPRYWINELLPHHRDRQKKRLKDIIRKYSKNLHDQIKSDIEQKCVIINRHFLETNCVMINRSNIELNITQSKISQAPTICPITLVRIPVQKLKDSRAIIQG